MNSKAPDITIPKQNVVASSKGQVATTTWDASDGFARSREIEKEREQAMAEYREKMTREDPILGRFIRLEEQVAKLQKQVYELSQSN